MKQFLNYLVMFTLLAIPLEVGGQTLSLEVFPSLDELEAAFMAGELDFMTYVRSREIALHKVDNRSHYLLDEIPNLSFIGAAPASMTTPLENQQQAGFVTSTQDTRRPGPVLRGQFDYRYYQRLDDEESAWYQTSTDLTWGNQWRSKFRIDAEENGSERIVSRSLSYLNSQGAIRTVTLGSFATRFGLGTTFGYRGKVFNFSRELDSESAAYPDYGGYNGLLVEGRRGRADFAALASVVRDGDHRLSSVGGRWQVQYQGHRPGLVVGANQLVDRHSAQKLTLPMLAMFNEYRYAAGQVAGEIGIQSGDRAGVPSAVVEGFHQFVGANVRYAAWAYDSRMIDLTAGSKAAVMYRTEELEKVDLALSSKRPGQQGVWFRTIVPLTDRLDLSNSVLYASHNRFHSNRELASSLVYRFGKRFQTLVRYLNRHRVRPGGTVSDAGGDHRYQLETRLNLGQLRARTYIAYSKETGKRDHWSWLTTIRYQMAAKAKLELWSNLSRLYHDGPAYWYAYLRGEQPLGGNLLGALKLAHTYSQAAEQAHRARAMLELKLIL